MSWLFGGTSKTTKPTYPDTRLRIQSSVAGKVRPIIYGRVRLAPNLIWDGDFFAVPQSQGGGKGILGGGGGKGGGGPVTYNYWVAVIHALCEGPIARIYRMWNNNEKRPRKKLPYYWNFFDGSYTQTAWSYVTSRHPKQALNYRGLSLLTSLLYLGNSSTLPNVSFEPESLIRNGYTGVPDANPKDVIVDFITNPHYGTSFPAANLDTALTQFSNWCIATGMVISDALVSARPANEWLKDLANALICEFVWSSGKLTLVPYSRTGVTGHGVTFTPETTIRWNFTRRDFLPNRSGAGSMGNRDPVLVQRKRQSDVINSIQVEYFARSNNYDPTVFEAKNDADIQVNGLRADSIRAQHFFCLVQAASVSAHLQLARQANRNIYKWTVAECFVWLDPMDLVTVTDEELGLVEEPACILEMSENGDSTLTITAEQHLDNLFPILICVEGSAIPTSNSGSLQAAPGATIYDILDSNLCLMPGGPSLSIYAAGAATPNADARGETGIISFWHWPKYFADNPTVTGTQRIVQLLRTGTLGVDDAEITVWFEFDGPSHKGHYKINGHAPDSTGVNRTFSLQTPDFSLTQAYGVMAQWDFSANTWALQISYDQNLTTTTVAAAGPLRNAILQETTSTVIVSRAYGGEKQEMYLGHIYVGVDEDVEGLDIGGAATWNLFFYNTDAMNEMGQSGEFVNGLPPFLFFPYNADNSNLMVSTGRAPFPYTPIGSGTDATSLPQNLIPSAPTCGLQEALHFYANREYDGIGVLGDTANNWGGVVVWVSTDDGDSYIQKGVISTASPIGFLTAPLPSHADPDNTDTISVDLTASQGSLVSVTAAEKDAFLSLCKIGDELVSYQDATLTSTFNFDLTSLRRGAYETAPALHAVGTKFTRLLNGVTFDYDKSLIGTTIKIKLQPMNSAGGVQDLSTVDPISVVLGGPAAPPAPASLSITETSGLLTLAWPESEGCGIDCYNITYKANFDPATADKGTLTFWHEPADPGAVKVVSIFDWSALAGGFAFEVTAVLGSDGVTPGYVADKWYINVHIQAGLVGVGGFALDARSNAMNISGGAVGGGFEWDFSSGTASYKIVVNQTDVTTTVSLSDGVVDGTTILQPHGVLMMGEPGWSVTDPPVWVPAPDATVFGKLSQVWCTLGTMMNLTGSDWTLFFDGSNLPIDLGPAGALPTGVQPPFFFPTNVAAPGRNAGFLGDLTYSNGTWADGSPPGPSPAKGLQVTGDTGLAAVTPMALDINVLVDCVAANSFTVTAPPAGDYNFSVAARNTAGVLGTPVTAPFTVT